MEVKDYILNYLLGDDELIPLVGYTSDISEWGNYEVVIVPSGFFDGEDYGKVESEPRLPLSDIGGLPVLFGGGEIEEHDNGRTKIVYGDVVASAFYLMSRYEEWIYRDDERKKDEHGRFVGKESLAYRAGILERPIVEEWGAMLRLLLGKDGGQGQGIREVYLTHDVDNISHYRTLRGLCGGLMRSMFVQKRERFVDVWKGHFSLDKDPAFTYPYIIAEDRRLREAKKIYFIKAGKGQGYDYPQYNLRGCDFMVLRDMLDGESNTEFGLHTSYYSCEEKGRVRSEIRTLEQQLCRKIAHNRYHYLRTVGIEDFRSLIRAGVEHDYSMGYADVVGFRLGTCRPVRWIDPEDMRVTDLYLHPLTVMDATLSRTEYMGMPEEEAYARVKKIIELTNEYAGELVFLWHNTSFIDGYHSRLYNRVIGYLEEKKK